MGPLDPILDATSAAKSQVFALGLAHWTTQPATTGDGVAGKRPVRTAIFAYFLVGTHIKTGPETTLDQVPQGIA